MSTEPLPIRKLRESLANDPFNPGREPSDVAKNLIAALDRMTNDCTIDCAADVRKRYLLAFARFDEDFELPPGQDTCPHGVRFTWNPKTEYRLLGMGVNE